MTVETLIKKLQNFPKDAVVRLNYHLGDPCLFVLAVKGDNENVWLEGEYDCDMGAELSARFDYALENQVEELDFYSDLLEIGIDVDMVRRYMGEDAAEHMKEFCYEHGLL